MELFRLLGTIAVNNSEANESIDQTTDKANGFAEKFGSVMSVVGKVAMAMASTVAASMAAVGTAVVKITKDALENYADYEQLVGGSKLMFGDAYDFVAKKAQEAYKTVQMSQNDYLQQMNGFATGLKTALDGDAKAAAVLADKILTAEADVVAATGNSQEAVQNAFNGIMKSNYTMLDNLQLGITPTKEGFQEVIDKVNEWNATQGKATNYQIDNLADAESALVDYVKMQGLAGYASAEASETITGSLTSVKAAWQNLLTGMADGEQDINGLINNLIDSASAFGDNIVPRIAEALPRVVEGTSKLVEKAAGHLPDILKKLVPALSKGTTSLLLAIATQLPALLSDIIPTVLNALNTFVYELLIQFPSIMEGLLGDVGGQIGKVFIVIFGQGFEAVKSFLPQIMEILSELTALFPVIVDSMLPLIDLIGPMTDFISTVLDLIIALLPPTIEIISVVLPPLVQLLVNIISNILPRLTSSLKDMTDIITKYVIPFVQKLIPTFSEAFNYLLKVIESFLGGVIDTLQGPLDIIVGLVGSVISLINGDVDGAKEYLQKATKGIVDTIFGILKTVFPQILFFVKDGFIEKIKNFFLTGFNNVQQTVQNVTQKILNTITTKFNSIYSKITSTMQNASNYVNDMINRIRNAFNFSWSLPHLKLPHIKISGSWSMKPPSAPSFAVDWYAKAMDNPMILTQPTAFGFNQDGQLMAGGEAGDEVVSGKDTLINLIGDVVSQQNAGIQEALEGILTMLSQYMPQLANMNVVMDSGAVVGELAPAMDMALGRMATRSERGIR